MSGAELARLDALAERFDACASEALSRVTAWRPLRSHGHIVAAATFEQAATTVRERREELRQDMTQCHCAQCETRRSVSFEGAFYWLGALFGS